MLPADTLDDIVREWARAKIQKMDILNHNGAMLAYTSKAELANRVGLTDRQKLGVTPFPSPPSSVTVTQQGTAPEVVADDTATKQFEQEVQALRNVIADLKTPRTETATTPAPAKSWPKTLAGLGATAVTAAALTWGATKLGNEPAATQPGPALPAVVVAAEEPTDGAATNNGSVGLEVEGWLRPNR